MGLYLGKIQKYNEKKGLITIKLNEPIKIGDKMCIRDRPTSECICSGVTPSAFVELNIDIVSLSSSGTFVGSVSYTHLDVYKRQLLHSVFLNISLYQF